MDVEVTEAEVTKHKALQRRIRAEEELKQQEQQRQQAENDRQTCRHFWIVLAIVCAAMAAVYLLTAVVCSYTQKPCTEALRQIGMWSFIGVAISLSLAVCGLLGNLCLWLGIRC